MVPASTYGDIIERSKPYCLKAGTVRCKYEVMTGLETFTTYELILYADIRTDLNNVNHKMLFANIDVGNVWTSAIWHLNMREAEAAADFKRDQILEIFIPFRGKITETVIKEPEAINNIDVLRNIVQDMTMYAATHVYSFDTDTPEPRRIPVTVTAVSSGGNTSEIIATSDNGLKLLYRKTVKTKDVPEILDRLKRQQEELDKDVY